MSYTKLFSEIVTSTIWSEDDKTRIIWITMLATANKHGEVMASVPGLAKIASISLEDTEKALERLQSADPYSRSPDMDGRRIEPIAGGWHLINYAKYRSKMDDDDRKAKAAERARRYRERKKRHASVTQNHAASQPVTESHDKQKQRQSTKAESTPRTPPKGAETTKQAEAIYAQYPRKVGKPRAIRAIKQALKREEYSKLLNATVRFKQARESMNPGFTPHPSTWYNQERYNDDPETWKDADATKPKSDSCL